MPDPRWQRTRSPWHQHLDCGHTDADGIFHGHDAPAGQWFWKCATGRAGTQTMGDGQVGTGSGGGQVATICEGCHQKLEASA